MLEIHLFIDFLLAAALGMLIGLEREKTYARAQKSTFAGIRTLTLISIFGYVV